jgi:hypothetical protein
VSNLHNLVIQANNILVSKGKLAGLGFRMEVVVLAAVVKQ